MLKCIHNGERKRMRNGINLMYGTVTPLKGDDINLQAKPGEFVSGICAGFVEGIGGKNEI